MAEISPVPPEFRKDRDVAHWCNDVVKRTSDATTTKLGTVKKSAARADSGGANLAALTADFNDLLAKLRAAGILST